MAEPLNNYYKVEISPTINRLEKKSSPTMKTLRKKVEDKLLQQLIILQSRDENIA